jgi:membrane protease YdiL (CAAX protease family)
MGIGLNILGGVIGAIFASAGAGTPKVGAAHADWTADQEAVMYVIAGTIVAVGGLVIVARLRRMPWASRAGLEMRARGRDAARAAWWLVLAAPVVQTAAAVGALESYVFTKKLPDPIAHETLREVVEHPGTAASWAFIFSAVVLAPLGEEILFRVLVQSLVLRVTGRVWLAIVVTSTLFAAVHLGAVEWHSLPPLFVLGVGLGVAYERSGRPAVPIAMHMMFNAASIGVALALGGRP